MLSLRLEIFVLGGTESVNGGPMVGWIRTQIGDGFVFSLRGVAMIIYLLFLSLSRDNFTP